MARLKQPLVTVVALAVSSIVLAACGGAGGIAQAQSACKTVSAGLALNAESKNPSLSAAQRGALEQRAIATILSATGQAAKATTADGTWNVLQTTIGEAGSVPLDDIAHALTAICAQANSGDPSF